MTDWKRTYRDALAAATGKLGSQGKDAHAYMKVVAKAHERSLESLHAAFADGKIDEETFESELAEERRVLRGELLAAEDVSSKGAQDAAKAFFAVIQTGIRGRG